MTEIKRMSLAEYRIRMKAYKLRRLDRENEIAYQAWLNREVQATKKRGKSTVAYYKRYKDFFDFEERENMILGKEKKHSALAQRYIEGMRLRNGNRND